MAIIGATFGFLAAAAAGGAGTETEADPEPDDPGWDIDPEDCPEYFFGWKDVADDDGDGVDANPEPPPVPFFSWVRMMFLGALVTPST